MVINDRICFILRVCYFQFMLKSRQQISCGWKILFWSVKWRTLFTTFSKFQFYLDICSKCMLEIQIISVKTSIVLLKHPCYFEILVYLSSQWKQIWLWSMHLLRWTNEYIEGVKFYVLLYPISLRNQVKPVYHLLSKRK